MGAPRRTKLTAGAGLVTMLVGALMVVAPTSAGADTVEASPPVIPVVDGKVTVCHRTNSTTNPYREADLNVEAANPSATNDHTSHSGPVFDPSATYPTPRTGDQWGDIVPAYDTDGDGFADDEGLNWSDAAHAIWSNGCAAPASQQPEAHLTVVKAVTGEIPDAGWSFDFTVDNDEIDAVAITLAGTVGDSQASTDPALALSPGTYDIVELSSGAADFVSWSCSEDGAAEPFLSSTDAEDLDAQVALENGDAVTCTFTNDFPEQGTPQADITVVKNVTGAVPANWSAEVTIDDGEDPVTVPLAGTSAAATDTDEVTVGTGTYAVSETSAGGATLVSGTCVDDAAEPGADPLWKWSEQTPAAQLTLADTDAVTCTFTNHFASQVVPPQPLPASLEVTKVVSGDVPAGPWTFDFGLVGPGTDQDFDLRLGDASESFAGLVAGAYTITEARPDGDDSTLADVTCRDGDLVVDLTGVGDSRTVTLAAGADVVCTFTNDYPEVQDTTVTVPPSTTTPPTTVAPPTTEAPTTTAPAAEVAGETIVRTLPRTGNETRNLAGFGGALLALGAALVLASNRRLGSIS